MADSTSTVESNIRRSSLVRKPTKMYRLKFRPDGLPMTHSVPRQDADPQFAGDPEAMHQIATSGDLVPLNDDQYKAFKDKFDPAEGDASDVAAADRQELADAKTLAAATGQTVNPNIPLSQQQPKAPTPPAR